MTTAISQPSVSIAIGDLHGHLPALNNLLNGLSKHLGIFVSGQKLKPNISITFTGDYVDRGESSLQVVQTIMDLQSENPDNVHCLMGNHELLSLTCLDDIRGLLQMVNEKPNLESEMYRWYRFFIHGNNGGNAFVQNFGESPRIAFENYLKSLHRDESIGKWLRNLKPSHRETNNGKSILFVHAGIPNCIANPSELERYIEKFREHLSTVTNCSNEKYHESAIFNGNQNIFWDRTIPKGSDSEAIAKANNLNADYVVIGHTPQRNGIIGNYGNRIFNIDVGMCPAYGENIPTALIFNQNGVHSFNSITGTNTVVTTK